MSLQDLVYTPRSVDARPRDRRNANPNSQNVTKARQQALELPPLAKPDNNLLARQALTLAGSVPVPLADRTGCAWAVGDTRPHLFCNLEIAEGSKLPYCREHLNRYHAKGGEE